MSDIFKKIKSVFIETNDAAPAKTDSKAPESKTPAATTAPVVQETASSQVFSSSSGGGTVNDRFMEALFGALERSNQDGFDYFEYKQSLRNLAKISLDERTRFQSAYAMAQTMGTNREKLIESAKFYVSVLDNEQGKFDQAHQQQRSKLIGNREQEVQAIEAGINRKAEEIKRLTQEIEQDRARGEQLKAEIQEGTLKIEQTHRDFVVTLEALKGQIVHDISKIQEFLG